MGKSQQLGWIVLKGKRWYGYYRKSVTDPETEDVRVNIVPVRLGLKSQMTKGAAHAALRDEIAKHQAELIDQYMVNSVTSHVGESTIWVLLTFCFS